MIFDPDDFRNDPYAAGLNQIGHMVFGAALAVFLGYWAGIVVIAWEWYQYRNRGALKCDYWADWFFWTFGVFAFQWEYFLPSVVLMGGIWMGVTKVVSIGDDLDDIF